MGEEQERTQAAECGINRKRLSLGCMDEYRKLIPSLPDELFLQILARVPRGTHTVLRAVCKAWHQVLAGDEIFKLRKQLKLTEEWLYVLVKDEQEELVWHVLDPTKGQWMCLPPIPEMNRDDETRDPSCSGRGRWMADESSSLRVSGLFKGCSAAVIDGILFVVGGFSRDCAMKCVWRYNARTNAWTEAASMGTPRAYCKTGLLDNKLFAVGGIHEYRGGLTPLQSAEVYEPETDSWISIPDMPFSRRQVFPITTSTPADRLNSMATGMAAFNGKLCVPQCLYESPFFIDVRGEMYDPISNEWVEMPAGMSDGWPASMAATKQSVVVNCRLYALDPSRASDGSKIKTYDSEHDSWRVVVNRVPIRLDVTDSECPYPYLLVGFREKVHLVTKDMNNNIAVLRADFKEAGAPSGSNGRQPPRDIEDDGWETIATRRFRTVELVACQVLDL